MVRAHRPVVAIAIPLFIVILTAVTGSTPFAAAARPAPQDRPPSMRITTAANVTLRAQPSAGSEALARLPLGTDVADTGPAGPEKTWARVRLAEGREGWVLASLTKPIDPHWRWPTWDRIVEDRLGRKGDGFSALAELVAFIERVAPEYTDPDGRGRIEASRLRAMTAALAAIPVGRSSREPYASWLKSHEPEAIPNEVAGQWMLSPRAVWDAESRHASTAAADDLAWLAVTTGLPGECEGVLTCYLEWYNRLHGEYLRRQPAGRHAVEAVAAIQRLADDLVRPRKANEGLEFDKSRDCRDLVAGVEALATAVKGARTAGGDAALAGLAALRKFCQ